MHTQTKPPIIKHISCHLQITRVVHNHIDTNPLMYQLEIVFIAYQVHKYL